jgi:ADP-ribose pyrophosphatase
MTKWRRGPKSLVYENPFFQVHQSSARSDHAEKSYYIVDFGRRAGVVALDGTRVLLVRQFRYLANGPCWEIPGGTVGKDERPEDAAVRETLEETGIRCHDLEPLLTYYPSLDNVDNRTYLYLCRRCEAERPFAPDPHEVSELCWAEIDEALRLCAVGDALDGFTALALLAARARVG